MTQEEKQLLLKVICGMLPYEVKANVTLFNKNRLCVITGVSLNRSTGLYSIEIRKQNRELQHVRWPTNVIKPYLRPMTSMTEDEQNRYDILIEETMYRPGILSSSELINYLIAHHLDYHGLIPMGLALEAPEDMYNIK